MMMRSAVQRIARRAGASTATNGRRAVQRATLPRGAIPSSRLVQRSTKLAPSVQQLNACFSTSAADDKGSACNAITSIETLQFAIYLLIAHYFLLLQRTATSSRLRRASFWIS